MSAPRTAARSCWAAALVLGGATAVWGLRFPYALERELWWIRSSGYLALGALFLSLSMTPLLRLRRSLGKGPVSAAPWLAFRRSLGISAAVLAALHGALVLGTYLEGSWGGIFALPYSRAGGISLVILLVLLASSFPGLNRRLGIRLWNELHRLVYVAAFFLFQHLLLAPFAPRRRTLAVFGALLAVSLLRLLPTRRGRGARAAVELPMLESQE